ncbi:glycogen synthase [Paenibacillus sp. CCS19]|uniref:glycogen synthase GlgA n=1 Tax=Paenibacillus sp. CCS19 TaxID=3158387 RepID=UPI0025604CA5|nr:glycogen synthase GlgA [Paenibacillus cellulosilyticus]GMK38009.1 glycogen synthase [Paenibacillus cellulosilyticus]
MKVLFAASEAVPLAKSGGLGDVTGALPKALNERGAEVRVVLPKYADIPASFLEHFETIHTFSFNFSWRHQYCGLLRGVVGGVTFYLIDNEQYFKRDGLYGYEDDPERFVFFNFAIAECLPYMDFVPDIIHCHDWQTALLPFLLKTRYAFDPLCRSVRTVFTIHNLRYQGVFGQKLFQDLIGMDDFWFWTSGLEFHGAANCMKAGLQYADRLTTVSETYAQEIQTEYWGENLDGVIRWRASELQGILNGIDTDSYDPMNDPALDTPYRGSISRKRKNKTALQRELGLPVSESVPVVGIVTRLVEQKGIDLIDRVLGDLLDEGIQLVILGAGDYRYEEMLRGAAKWRPEQIALMLGYDEGLARRIYAGSDMFLMPSWFEPCGLSQLIALRYRTVPIVRETGGLRDTVQSYNEYTGTGNGFTFASYNAHDMLHTVRRALEFYRNEEDWKTIVANGAKEDYSWSRSARSYMSLYSELLPLRKETDRWPVIS